MEFQEELMQENFENEGMERPAQKKLPNLPKTDPSDTNRDWYTMATEYFKGNGKDAPSADNPTIDEPAADGPPSGLNGDQGRKGKIIDFASAPTEKCKDEKSPTLDSEAFTILDPRNGKLVIVPQMLTMHLLSEENEKPIIVAEQPASKTPEVYIYEDGYYQSADKQKLRKFVKDFLPIRYRTPADIDAVCYEINTESPTLTMNDLNSDENIINFENGLKHLDTEELTPHTPDVLSTIRIPCNYRPGLMLEDAPIFKQFLEDLTSEDSMDQACVLEFIGALVSNVPGSRFIRPQKSSEIYYQLSLKPEIDFTPRSRGYRS